MLKWYRAVSQKFTFRDESSNIPRRDSIPVMGMHLKRFDKTHHY